MIKAEIIRNSVVIMTRVYEDENLCREQVIEMIEMWIRAEGFDKQAEHVIRVGYCGLNNVKLPI